MYVSMYLSMSVFNRMFSLTCGLNNHFQRYGNGKCNSTMLISANYFYFSSISSSFICCFWAGLFLFCHRSTRAANCHSFLLGTLAFYN